jgi:hypothetical protein
MDSAKGSGLAPKASLAPIFVAFLSVVSVSLLGFVVAFWPEEPARPRPPAAQTSVTAAPQSFDGESDFVPMRERGRGRWM